MSCSCQTSKPTKICTTTCPCQPSRWSVRASAYLAAHDKHLDKTCSDLYELGFVNYVRASVSQCTFFRAKSRASMKMNVVYVVDICVDSNGVIEKCQCECGAGMGPSAHCKHVCTVLYGLTKFAVCGDFITQLTCMQTLQTFHHRKKHTGSPRKVCQLPLPQFTYNTEFDPHPHPVEYRQQASYTDYFRNTCIGSGQLHNSCISHCFVPANPCAVILDHSYHCAATDNTMEQFLKSLRVTEITQDEVHQIQHNTIGQANNSNCMNERQKRLTSSRFGRICKMTSATNGCVLARSYLNEKDLDTAAITYGRTYESAAVKKYEATTGKSTKGCGLFVSLTHPFLSASPGCVVSDGLLVEVKCPFTARDAMVTPETVPYIVCTDNELSLNRKHDYYYQVQGQMFCTGATAIDFVVFTQADIKVMCIAHDDMFIHSMVEKLQNFFKLYFRQALLDKFVTADYYEYILCNCVRFNNSTCDVDN